MIRWRAASATAKVPAMADDDDPAPGLAPVDSLVVDVVTDDVSDTYVSKTLFAVSEFANVILAGAKILSGEALLCANLGLGLRLVSKAGEIEHTLLFDTGPEGTIFLRNCAEPRHSPGRGRMHRGQSRTLGSHGGASRHDRCDRARGRPGCGPCQSGNVQRTRHQARERNRGARRQGPAPGCDGGTRSQGGQSARRPAAARSPLLLQRRNSTADTVRERPHRPSEPHRSERSMATGPTVDGRAHAGRARARFGTDRLQRLLACRHRQRMHRCETTFSGHSDPLRDGWASPRRRDGADHPTDGGWTAAVRNRAHHHGPLHRLASPACSGQRIRRRGQSIGSRHALHVCGRPPARRGRRDNGCLRRARRASAAAGYDRDRLPRKRKNDAGESHSGEPARPAYRRHRQRPERCEHRQRTDHFHRRRLGGVEQWVHLLLAQQQSDRRGVSDAGPPASARLTWWSRRPALPIRCRSR